MREEVCQRGQVDTYIAAKENPVILVSYFHLNVCTRDTKLYVTWPIVI